MPDARPANTNATLNDRLRSLAQSRDALDVAQFQFIGLDEIQRVYGANWRAHKDKIKDVAQDFLQRRIDSNDVLIRGADGFLIVFGEAKGHEASCSAANLSHSLNEFFVGDAGQRPAPRFGHQNSSVPVNDLVQTLGDVEFQSPIGDPATEVSPGAIEWRFQPTWDVKREVISQYFAIPVSKETGERVPGYQYEPLPGRPPKYTAVDETSLQVSEHALRGLFKQGKRALVGTLVHVSSLTNVESRTRLLAVMDKFNRDLQRFKILKVAGVPPGFPRIYFDEIMATLKSRVPNVAVNCAWDDPDLAVVAQSSAVAIGFALPHSVVGPNPTVANAELLTRIRTAASIAHASRKQFYVTGPYGPELAVRLSALGVDTLGSPNVWKLTTAPDGVVNWPADKLIQAGVAA